jgi:hypothetical protein
MTGYQCYIMFNALKRHFSDKNYDFIKYHGKVRLSKESFDKNNAKFLFESLSKRKDPKGLVISNLIRNDMWIKDILSVESEKNYNAWVSRTESLKYTFQNQLELLSDNIRNEFMFDGDEYPPLLKKYLSRKIQPETLVILNDQANFLRSWYAKTIDTIIIPDVIVRLWKYKSFLQYDSSVMNKILVDKYSKCDINI